ALQQGRYPLGYRAARPEYASTMNGALRRSMAQERCRPSAGNGLSFSCHLPCFLGEFSYAADPIAVFVVKAAFDQVGEIMGDLYRVQHCTSGIAYFPA